ncbi:MAG: hypothetical protein DWQ40_13655 [Actinobacteria bacterium]|nr:MAG: hypothetical protein DWQ40_13655 [Actinomycetota bacterium]REK42360.1 MAG: hypothetical protein DWQ20_00040 [Actinomycetota bacterium]
MRRISRIVVGSMLLVAGLAMLILPGPGLITIFAGLSVLATEFMWASGIVDWAREKAALQRGERPSHSDDGGQTG